MGNKDWIYSSSEQKHEANDEQILVIGQYTV